MASNNNYVFEVEEILDQRFAGLKVKTNLYDECFV